MDNPMLQDHSSQYESTSNMLAIHTTAYNRCLLLCSHNTIPLSIFPSMDTESQLIEVPHNQSCLPSRLSASSAEFRRHASADRLRSGLMPGCYLGP